jgi:hypothetical protein
LENWTPSWRLKLRSISILGRKFARVFNAWVESVVGVAVVIYDGFDDRYVVGDRIQVFITGTNGVRTL